MEITFLGTSEAVPTEKKNHTAVLLKYENENILVDCGEGTQRQFRIARINPCKLTRILITHWHGDHVLGLPGLLQTLALNNYAKQLYIYGPKGTKRFLERMLDTFIFIEKIKLSVHEISKNGLFLETNNFQLYAYKMKHKAPCLAYRFVEKDKRKINLEFLKKVGLEKGPLLGKLQQGKDIIFRGKKITAKEATRIKKGRKIAFIFDTLLNENCFVAAKDVDVLVCEATFLDSLHRDKAKERFHLTAKQAAEIAKRANVKALILTHISQRYAKDEEVILKEAKKTFKNCILAHDFLKIKITNPN